MDSTENYMKYISSTSELQSDGIQNEHLDDSTEWQLLEPLCDVSEAVKQKFGPLDSLDNGDFQQFEFNQHSSHLSERNRELIHRWQQLATWCAKHPDDPWVKFHFDTLPVRNCKRHRYSSIHQCWEIDNVQVKLHPEPFARGAMRECYRLKKLGSRDKNDDWDHAQNYVAKKYIRSVDKEVLFEDVKLQMDSKLWAEEFNRHHPPKKIDIFQVCILEFLDEEHAFYHLERFIEGEYIKYNSNSGFVADVCRKTPQAFSHFTFERSGHQLIVVDIQGVGDLYTDPQIHTATGEGYGSGNLGTRGMALFFHSHMCNDICRSMCLTEFDLSEGERNALKRGVNVERNWNSLTRSSSNRPASICSSLVEERGDAMEKLRRRTVSVNSSGRRSSASSFCDEHSTDTQHSDVRLSYDCFEQVLYDSDKSMAKRFTSSCSSNLFDSVDNEAKEVMCQDPQVGSLSSCSSRMTREAEREAYWFEKRKLSRPAGLLSESKINELSEFSQKIHGTNCILGQIHLDLARYHELGQFVDKSTFVCSEIENIYSTKDYGNKKNAGNYIDYDKDAAFYHLDIARRCGVLEAIITMAKMAFGQSHELLKEVICEEVWENDDLQGTGFELMECAANMGDQSAVIFIAQAYETGRFLGPMKKPSWPKAVIWYEKALNFLQSSETNENETPHEGVRPRYELLERMAIMYKEGGYGLLQDLTKAYDLYTEAAVSATEAMRGKLANKYYELAEQCV
ncbi:unnamed protein product [Onchocerca ochengi]|uniref:Alpha-type protein kinase domain-containing protein n=1 Tax=Onchocerca ochengi TaxID=42157 RepID=A0A182E4P7_ONCOC|nr:unnamed protein product [Onchocerca ochengi]